MGNASVRLKPHLDPYCEASRAYYWKEFCVSKNVRLKFGWGDFVYTSLSA